MITRKELDQFLKEVLRPELFSDYGPNGLQIEGKEKISKIAFSVSATKESVTKACELGADALVVHHGLFWSFHGPKTITGAFGKRVIPLIKNEISLFGYHLPLDAHLEVGNAAGVAKKIELINTEAFGEYKGATLGVKGEFKTPLKASALKEKLSIELGHPVLLASPDKDALIKSVGIITGGANKYWPDAKKAGLDAYITGEMSEHDWHEARESDMHMFAGGHHATERFGVLSLMDLIKNKFSVECHYIESDNEA
jgi:dinuclear metal center YbgI/SA1388 family protein